MKLAEALSIRKDLQTRISELTARLMNNVKIQEGDEPAEDPKDLLKELDSCLMPRTPKTCSRSWTAA